MNLSKTLKINTIAFDCRLDSLEIYDVLVIYLPLLYKQLAPSFRGRETHLASSDTAIVPSPPPC